jgi:4-hydroxybenzoate polyprenyltransferase
LFPTIRYTGPTMPTVVRKLLELIRFSHTIFALPFALLAAALAWTDESFRWQDCAGILLCMVFARSAAMAFNRVADRHIDAANPRTATRHLPAGTLSVAVVWGFTLLCCAGFVASTLLFYTREPANPWPLYLSGWPGSTSFMPARTPRSTKKPGCTVSLRGSACR